MCETFIFLLHLKGEKQRIYLLKYWSSSMRTAYLKGEDNDTTMIQAALLSSGLQTIVAHIHYCYTLSLEHESTLRFVSCASDQAYMDTEAD